MINNISLRNLRNAEIVQFLTSGLVILNADSTVKAAISAPRITLANVAGVLDGLFATDPASPLTDDLLELDITRDGYINGLTTYCKSFLNHPNAAKRDAAATLLHNIGIYGDDITRQSYNAESASITNLLEDWSTNPELVAAGVQIDTSEFTSALETANNAFVNLYDQRTVAMAANVSPDTMKTKRAEAVTAWKAVCDKVSANAVLVDGAAPWGTVVNQLNMLIDQYNAVLLSRAGRAAAQKQKAAQAQEAQPA